MLTSGLEPISSKKYFLVNLYIKISAIDWPLCQLRYKIKEMISLFFFSFFLFSLFEERNTLSFQGHFRTVELKNIPSFESLQDSVELLKNRKLPRSLLRNLSKL